MRSERSLLEKGTGEYFVMSKEWFEYAKEVDFSKERDRLRPINDLQSIKRPDNAFVYYPESHPWNLWIQEFLNPWNYELVKFDDVIFLQQINKEFYIFLEQKFKSIGPIVRRAIYSERSKHRVTQKNLRKITLILKNPVTGEIGELVAQIDFNYTVKEWVDFVLQTLSQTGVKSRDARVWMCRVADLKHQLANLRKGDTEIDGKLLDQKSLWTKFTLENLQTIVFDIELNENNWQFKSIEAKRKFKETFTKVIGCSKGDCHREFCSFMFCMNNPKFKSLQYKQDQLVSLVLQNIKESPNITGCEPCQEVIKSLHLGDLKNMFLQQQTTIQELKQFAQIFSSLIRNLDGLKISFLEGVEGPREVRLSQFYGQLTNDELFSEKAPLIDWTATRFMNQVFRILPQMNDLDQAPIKKHILDGINHTFPFKNEQLGQINSRVINDLLELRGVFILLCCNLIFEDDILIQLHGFIKTIKDLSPEHKKVISQWLTYIPDQDFKYCVEQLKSQITILILQEQGKQDHFLDQYKALQCECYIEMLQLYQRTNLIIPKIESEFFVTEQCEQLYSDLNEQEEFLNYRYFMQKYYREFVWCFCRWPWILTTKFKVFFFIIIYYIFPQNQVLSIESRVIQNQQVRQFHRQILNNPLELMQQEGDVSPYLILKVNRQDLIHTTLEQLNKRKHQLRYPLKVQFEGEQGLDEGGVKREYFLLLTQQLFTPLYGMFVLMNNESLLWFNSRSHEMPIQYELMGILLGLALYNQVLLDIRFPQVVFKKIMNEPTSIEDLKYLDPILYSSLVQVDQYDKPDLEQVLCLSFTTQTYESYGEFFTDELKVNGANISVNQDNKKEYIELYVDWFLNKSIKKQFDLFQQGFKRVVDGDIIKIFTGEELSSLIMGSPKFDITELQAVTIYEEGYNKDSPIIKYFWEYIRSLPLQDQKRFLFFATGSDRVPIGGLGAMRFIIQKNGNDSNLLPTAHTCFNVLLLPNYSSKEKLIQKLSKAIENAEGFGLY